MQTRNTAHAARLWPLTLSLSAVLLASVATAQSPPAKPAKPAPRDEFTLWLVRIQYVHQLDSDPETAMRIAELQSKRDAATTPAERRTIDREIDKAKSEGRKHRPHAIYGWSVEADDAGKPTDSTRSMTGFIIAATDDNNEAIADVQKAYEQGKPAVIMLHRERSKELFTFAGRHWRSVARATFIEKPADIGEPAPFDIPPSKPLTAADRSGMVVALKHERSEASDKGNTLHRYWLNVQCDQPPVRASRLKLWLASHVEIQGATIGPIMDCVEISRDTRGTFSLSRSFEFIALPGVKLNAHATTVKPLAIVWE